MTYTIIAWDCRQIIPSPHTDDYIFWVKVKMMIMMMIMMMKIIMTTSSG